MKKAAASLQFGFPTTVVAEIEKGYLTYKQVLVKQGIEGRSTVLVALSKHGSWDWKSKTYRKKAPPKQTDLRGRLK